MSPFLSKPTILYTVLGLFWAVGGIALYRGEWQSLQEIPVLARMERDDKKLSSDGPIYVLARMGSRLLGSEEQILFFNPAAGPEGEYYAGKLKYYLYPRRLIAAGPDQNLTFQDLSEPSAAFIYEPKGRSQSRGLQILENLPFWEKIFEFEREFGYQAIFRNIRHTAWRESKASAP